jgi:hypothetical protein
MIEEASAWPDGRVLLRHAWETPFVHPPKTIWSGEFGCKRIVEQAIGAFALASTSSGSELCGHSDGR